MRWCEPDVLSETTIVHERDVRAVIQLNSISDPQVAAAQEPPTDFELGLQLARHYHQAGMGWSGLMDLINTRLCPLNERLHGAR